MEMRTVLFCCKLSLFICLRPSLRSAEWRQNTEWRRKRTDRVTLDEDGRSQGVGLFQFCCRRDRVSGESSPACSLTGH